MPIGKNAIKRVKNNGYSNVESSAPDMENSVIANPDEQVIEVMVKPVEEKTAKKSPAKKTAKKTAPKNTEGEGEQKPAKKSSAKKTAKKPAQQDGFARVEVGESMPYYLL